MVVIRVNTSHNIQQNQVPNDQRNPREDVGALVEMAVVASFVHAKVSILIHCQCVN